MGRRWVWVAGGLSAGLMVAVGVAINQVLNNRAWSWPWFAAAMVFAAATVVVDRWVAAAERPRAILRPDLVGAKGNPLLISQVSPIQLGVHPSRFGVAGDSPYVARDADDTLANVLRNGDRRVVMVQGPRLAGATRMLAHAAQAHLVGHLILAFAAASRPTLAQMVAEAQRAARGRDAVLWLDRVTSAHLGQLELGVLDDLPSRMWILATVYDKDLSKFQVPEHVRTQLEEKAVVVSLGVISGRERKALRNEPAYAPVQPALNTGAVFLMGRLMVALEQIQDSLAPGRTEESAAQIALLQAVTDWYRTEMPTVLTPRVLERDLYPAYLPGVLGQGGHRPVSATGFQRALTWATAKNSDERPQLVDLERVGQLRRYVPHALLTVVADDIGQPGSWPVAGALWEYADHFLDGDQRRDIGYNALDRGAYPFARRLLDHDDTQVAPAAMYEVADWLNATGHLVAARRWYERVTSTDDPDLAPVALVDLGLLEADQAHLGEARRWLEQAVDGGRADQAQRAMAALGRLEREQGDVAAARYWWERAAAEDDGPYVLSVMMDLGLLARDEGHLDEARRWWEQAAASEHEEYAPEAMTALAQLEFGQSDKTAARRWWEQAAASGNHDQAPPAMVNLGVLARDEGHLDEARRWWEQATASEHQDYAPRAMNALGELEFGQGDKTAARRWWEQAAASGNNDQAPVAMTYLGGLERLEGDRIAARRWLEQAAGSGHRDQALRAMVILAFLEKEERRPDKARMRLKQVTTSGHIDQAPMAMILLGILENEEGHPDEARRWLEQVIAVGHPGSVPPAMLVLANLESSQGNIDKARHWYGSAIDSDNLIISNQARQSLNALERQDSDLRRADHFATYGWQAYIDDSLPKPHIAHPNDGQTAADKDGNSPQ